MNSSDGLRTMTKIYDSFGQFMDKDNVKYDDFKSFIATHRISELLKETKEQPENKGLYTFLLYTQLFTRDIEYLETVIHELNEDKSFDFISALPNQAFNECLKIQIKYNLK